MCRAGNIVIPSGIYRPQSFTVQWFDKPGSGKVVREETRNYEYVGFGWHFQADEVARCVRDGKLESELWGHNKSLVEMEIFDEVSLVCLCLTILWLTFCIRFAAREATSCPKASRRSYKRTTSRDSEVIIIEFVVVCMLQRSTLHR
jgi:hypothetical protein